MRTSGSSDVQVFHGREARDSVLTVAARGPLKHYVRIETGEPTFRHWSNGGIRLPNHGQDFVTLTIRVN